MRTTFGAAALAGLMGLAGCGGSSSVEVDGAVSYDGQPVDAGAISFVSLGEKGSHAGGSIVNGKYAIPAEFGPKPGKYKVEIRWSKPTGKKFKSDLGEMLDMREEALPAKYHDKSELTAEITSGKNTVNFDLKK